ncbi:MAG: aminotransferase class V-fold PLP-dependent enzyme [Polyangiaceae bacterium]|nr:aminotransferase class V-fold PLP-dependent enzyme [Polyangiaceae bacterium]
MTPWLLDPNIVFLNHGSFGACPRPVLELQSAIRARIEADPVHFFVDELEAELDVVRHRVGDFVGAAPEDIALLTNATHASNAVFSSIALSPGDEIVVTNHGYAAVTNAALRWADRAGATVRVADIPLPIRDPSEAEAAIVAALRPTTRLVVVDQITSPTALVLPIASLVSACRARGVEVFVDSAHGPGMVTMRIDEVGAAYTTGNLHKWVCAPKGAAFLHVRRDLRENVRPLVTSHGASSPRVDRSRFLLEFDWTGTDDPTALLCVPAALDFLDSLHDDGIAGVQRENQALVIEARNLLSERLGLTLPCPESMIGSMAALVLPERSDLSSFQTHDRLYAEHKIQVPVMPWPTPKGRVLRVSAQRYNRLEGYEALARAVEPLL